MELEALAATIKVTPAKLAALENGRYEELHDAAFVRALAMAVCRALKVDPAQVLASLPSAQPVSLAASEPRHVPFKPTHARLNLDVSTSLPWRELLSARWLAPAAVLLAAALVYFWPQDMSWAPWAGHAATPVVTPTVAAPAAEADVGTPMAASAALPTDLAAQASGAASGPAISELASTAEFSASAVSAGADLATAAAQSGAASAVKAAAVSVAEPAVASVPVRAGSALVLISTESSWIEVRDAKGAKLLSRHVTAGETIGVDGTPPMAVKIGNAAGVQLTYRGSPIELAAFTHNNVARLELK